MNHEERKSKNSGLNALDPVTGRGQNPTDLKGGRPWPLWRSSARAVPGTLEIY